MAHPPSNLEQAPVCIKVVNTQHKGGKVRGAVLVLRVLGIAALLVCAWQQVPAQQEPPHRPLLEAITGKQHLPPADVNAQATPPVVIDATQIGSPLTLEKGWRVGVTANTAASGSDFDDLKWVVRNTGDSLDDLQDLDRPEGGAPSPEPGAGPHPRHGRPFVWFRLHVKLKPNHGPIALLIAVPVAQSATMNVEAGGPGVDVFANGKLITPEGPNGQAAGRYQEISRIYDLNVPPEETDLTLVIRTLYIPFGLASYTNFFTNRSLRLGHPADLAKDLESWSSHTFFEHLPRLVTSILFAVLAVFLLVLYFTQKGHAEYLWLALHELVQAPIGFIDLAGSTAQLDQLWYAAATLQLVFIAAYLYFEFLAAFLALPRRWYIWLLRYTAPILALAGPVLLMVGHSPVVGIILAVVLVGSTLWMAGWLAFNFITLAVATVRKNFEAGLLLIPLLLTLVGWVEPILTGGVTNFGPGQYHSPLTILAGPVPIHFNSVADFAGILSIVVIILVRFLRIQHDQERASSELAAARSVQELMIPREKMATPGYEVDSVYEPAHEVGGDFFHVQPDGDGSLLVVIGDVAGKGLKAAMNVSMLMGALRKTEERSPAKILESLNRVLAGSESLTTCQAIWFRHDGELVMANAGHLPPYINSQEVAVPGGLPLGAIPEVSYDEMSLYLHPGDRLLLLSDGVVEAREMTTGELFGFERVHNLSNQSAFYIADAAKAFGQEDDITVLTVRRLAETPAG